MAIFLLNHQHFTQRQVVLHYGNVRSKLDLSKLVKAMNEDSNTNLAILRNKGVDTPTIFGIIHPLIGSDILCSQRGFGLSWILKTCLDYATYLFDQESGIQLLGKDDPKAKGAYIRFIIALFKKKYSRVKQDQSYPWRALEASWWLLTTNFWDPEANMGPHHWVQIHAPFQRMPGAKKTESSIPTTDLDECYISHNSGSRPKYVWMGEGWWRVWTESRFWWEHQKTAGYLWCHHEEMWLQKQSLSL